MEIISSIEALWKTILSKSIWIFISYRFHLILPQALFKRAFYLVASHQNVDTTSMWLFPQTLPKSIICIQKNSHETQWMILYLKTGINYSIRMNNGFGKLTQLWFQVPKKIYFMNNILLCCVYGAQNFSFSYSYYCLSRLYNFLG